MHEAHLGTSYALPLNMHGILVSQKMKRRQTGTVRLYITMSPWATPCNEWTNNEGCEWGIACDAQHLGNTISANCCAVCGGYGHTVVQCKTPGGGEDPNQQQTWDHYRSQPEMVRFRTALAHPNCRRKYLNPNTIFIHLREEGENLTHRPMRQTSSYSSSHMDDNGMSSSICSDTMQTKNEYEVGLPMPLIHQERIVEYIEFRDDAVGLDSWANRHMIHEQEQMPTS